MNTNIVVIEGRITKNAEMKSAGATTVTSFSIANNQSYKKDGNWVDNAYFFECEIWGAFGETMRQYLNKGQKVTVTGQLVQNRWTDTNGKSRSSEKIRVKDLSIQFEKKATTPAESALNTDFNPAEYEENPYSEQQPVS